MSPRAQKKDSAGPIFGAAVVVILLVLGALYFGNARLNHQNSQDQLPFITGDTSTTTTE